MDTSILVQLRQFKVRSPDGYHGAQSLEGFAQVETLDPVITTLVDALDPNPCYVTGRRWDVLAANRAARLLWTDWNAIAAENRNMLWWTFTNPAARTILVHWQQEAAALLGRFRAAAARHADDATFQDLIERLHSASAEVRAWWPRYDVAPVGSGLKQLRHPVLGILALSYTSLQVVDSPDLKLVTFLPNDSDRAGLVRLLSGPMRKKLAG